jgi:hypothetical protein
MGIIKPDTIEKDSTLLIQLHKITIAGFPQATVDRVSKLLRKLEGIPRDAPSSLKEKRKNDSRLLAWKKEAKAFLKTIEVSLNPAKPR